MPSASIAFLPMNVGSIGVSVATGAIATTRTPWGAAPSARLFARATPPPRGRAAGREEHVGAPPGGHGALDERLVVRGARDVGAHRERRAARPLDPLAHRLCAPPRAGRPPHPPPPPPRRRR